MYEFWQRDVAMQRLYIGFEIARNHFRALNSATPKFFSLGDRIFDKGRIFKEKLSFRVS